MHKIALAAAVCLVSASAFGWEPLVTTVPSGRYRIVQQYNAPKDKPDGDGFWDTVLHFADHSKPDAILATAPDHYPWSADYHISPDEQWVLRIQKTGSGENSAFLYRVESSGRIWRSEQRLDDLACGTATAGSNLSRDDYYHVGVEFVSWDLSRQVLHLVIAGSPNDKGHPGLERKIDYRLKDGRTIAR